MEISLSDWAMVLKNYKLVKKLYPHYFRQNIFNYVNNSCTIAFYRIRWYSNRIVIHSQNSSEETENTKTEENQKQKTQTQIIQQKNQKQNTA